VIAGASRHWTVEHADEVADASTPLFDLATTTRPTFRRVLGTEGNEAGQPVAEIGMRPLVVGALQLDAARLGARLEHLAVDPAAGDALRLIADDYGVLSLASVNLAVRCSITAIDLCAAALGRLCTTWPTADGWEADVAALGNNKTKATFRSDDVAVTTALDVLRSAAAGDRWLDLVRLRHQVTHRHILRSVEGYAHIVLDSFGSLEIATQPPVPEVPTALTFAHSSVEMGGVHVPLDKVTADAVATAEDIFRRVCAALVGPW
jgi:hypothetical protein